MNDEHEEEIRSEDANYRYVELVVVVVVGSSSWIYYVVQ